MKRNYWPLKFPLDQYNEDVLQLAIDNHLTIINIDKYPNFKSSKEVPSVSIKKEDSQPKSKKKKK